MSKRKYNWKRYWCRREGQLWLLDDGFLIDPNSEAARYYRSDVVDFESIASKSCLVLLGEPGIGKSTALEREYATVKKAVAGSGDGILRVDLSEYSTDEQLSRKVFCSPKIQRWRRSSYILHLFLDSLDESRLRIDNISAVLRSELRELPTDRLCLRIVCRSADWPGDLEAAFRSTWGEDGVGVFELVPLTKSDVTEAAESWGIPPDKFLEAVAEVGVAPLANRPITLEFLLGAFSRGQSLPKNRTALYAEGCKLLCEEPSESRRDSLKGHGKLTANQRFEIAGRIAAMMQFSNRSTIWTGPRQNGLPEDVPLECFVGGTEGEWPATMTVDLPAVEEALGTGLFSARGLRRLGWSHQTYAEFLAAYYLQEHKMPSASILRLIQHPDGSGKVVPQLRETAAWLAGMNSEVFTVLATKDPEALLRSDMAGASDSDRSALAARLLDLFESREIVDDLELYSLFHHLTNPHLDGTIRPYLVDRAKVAQARHAAISIARACKLTALRNELVVVALDPTEDHHIRIGAAGAVTEIGDAASRAALAPLALGSAGDDPRDELKGLGLLASWPAHLKSTDLFSALTPRKDPRLFGTYYRFLSSGFLKYLHPDDLEMALKWAAHNIRGDPDVEPLAKPALEILALATDHVDGAGIPGLIAAVMINNWEFLSVRNSVAEKLSASEDLRHRIAAAMLPMVLAHQHGPLILMEACALTSHDLCWLLEVFEESGSAEARVLLAWVIPRLLDPHEVEAFDAALAAARTCALLTVELQPWVRPVPLDSVEAREMRERYRRIREHQSRPADQPPQSRPGTAELEAILDKATPDVFYEIWYRLGDGAVGANATPKEPISRWSGLDAQVKPRIFEAAKVYLMNYHPLGPAKWWKEGQWPYYEIAAYYAVALLHTQAPGRLAELEPDVWHRWTRIVISYPFASDAGSPRSSLLKLVYDKCPDTVLETISDIIDGENARHGMIVSVQHLEGLWGDRIADLVRGKLTGGAMRLQSFRNLLSLLLEKGDVPAQKYAESLVVGPIPADGEQREVVVGAAAELLSHAPESAWHIVWPAIKADRQFGLKVVGAAGVTFTAKLREEDVADFYLWLLPQQTGQGVPPDNSLADAHEISTLASMLGNRGTPEACRALRRVANERPHLEGLRWYLKQAEELARRKTWIPPSPKEVMKLVSDPSARLVRSADELVELLLESLERLQTRLRGKPPAVRDLWNELVGDPSHAGALFRPKDEHALSDYIKRHLDQDLGERGVIANREVKLSTYLGGAKGEQTDVHVDVTIPGVEPGVFEKLTVIIEVKGCWNPDLNHAMQTQLVDRYLTGGDCRHGIYVVGWFACKQWDPADRRKSATPKISLDDAAKQFASQASALSHSGVLVRSVVLNTTLP